MPRWMLENDLAFIAAKYKLDSVALPPGGLGDPNSEDWFEAVDIKVVA